MSESVYMHRLKLVHGIHLVDNVFISISVVIISCIFNYTATQNKNVAWAGDLISLSICILMG